MERLTKTYSDGTHGASDSLPCGENSYDYKNLLIEKLGKYEDLEEQGRLIKLPCKIGDVVYLKMASYSKTNYAEAEVRDFVHFISHGFCVVVTSKYFDKENIPFSEFGKTVFLTKSEAEAKLKELIGNNGKIEK